MKKIFLLLTMVLISSSLWAQEICLLDPSGAKPTKVSSIDVLLDMPVLDEGRIKPFDTFAKNVMLRFSGKKSYKGTSAATWMTLLLFAPVTVVEDDVFLINHPQVPVAIGIEKKKSRRYSYAELSVGFDKLLELAQAANQHEAKDRDIVEQEILRVFGNMILFSNFSRTFQFTFPDPAFAIADKETVIALGLPRGLTEFSFLDVVLAADNIHAVIKDIDKKEIGQWSQQERATVEILATMFQFSQQYRNMPFRVVPSTKEQEIWYSPWDAIALDFQDLDVRQELDFWRHAVAAYWQGNQDEFNHNIEEVKSSIAERAGEDHEREFSLFGLELFYNQAHYFLWAKLCYGLAFLLFLIGLASSRSWLRMGAFMLIAIGLIPHTIAIVSRMIIMDRPPVATLYETFIFVAWMSAWLGLIIEKFNKRWLGILVSTVSGLVLLFIASKYSADGDTMGMLIAVLNSNFWLSTHVITIVAGYSACCVAGLVGHIYCIQAVTKPHDEALLKGTQATLYGTLAFGLILTFLGTNLGGIWADQSWGRFWGWDPKENGAIMIVIWVAMLFHAKMGKMISPFGLGIGAVMGMMVVMWAWFGVNLLSVGLHSYGFTSGAGLWLSIYYIIELIFIGALSTVYLLRK